MSPGQTSKSDHFVRPPSQTITRVIYLASNAVRKNLSSRVANPDTRTKKFLRPARVCDEGGSEAKRNWRTAKSLHFCLPERSKPGLKGDQAADQGGHEKRSWLRSTDALCARDNEEAGDVSERALCH